MKFLVCSNHSYMLYRFRLELLLELKTHGDVVISAPYKGHQDDFAELGFKCIDTRMNRRGTNILEDLKLLRFYKKLIQTEKPDVVITYSIKPNVYAGMLCRRYHIPYFVNVQGLGTAFQSRPMAFFATHLYRTGLKGAKKVFFENQTNAKEFYDRKIIGKEKGAVLKGAGVNLDRYRQQPYPSEEGGIHILYLGRIMKEKGMDETFAAMEQLKMKYGDKVIFDVVGFFEDSYKDTVELLHEKGIIEFHGFQTDPHPYYAMAHGVVLASYHEGMSNVLLEAGATGRAIITTDIPGCREAVDDGVNGFLCKKKDVASLLACMERFLALTPARREAMGIAGRKKIETDFDKKQIVRDILSYILP